MLKVSSSAGSGVAAPGPTPKDVVRSLADIVSLVEPGLLELWRSTGLTFGQRRVLGRLRHGPRPAGAIAAELAIAAPTLTRQLQKLEENGFITRAIDTDDRRRILVALTANGNAVLAEHRVFRDSPLLQAAGELTTTQRRDLVESLGRLTRLARKGDAGSENE
jgi:DNA-binding MarR family transcriptional regulator